MASAPTARSVADDRRVVAGDLEAENAFDAFEGEGGESGTFDGVGSVGSDPRVQGSFEAEGLELDGRDLTQIAGQDGLVDVAELCERRQGLFDPWQNLPAKGEPVRHGGVHGDDALAQPLDPLRLDRQAMLGQRVDGRSQFRTSVETPMLGQFDTGGRTKRRCVRFAADASGVDQRVVDVPQHQERSYRGRTAVSAHVVKASFRVSVPSGATCPRLRGGAGSGALHGRGCCMRACSIPGGRGL